MKTLVVYHSLSGNTKYVAGIIAGELGADILGLKTKMDLGQRGFKMYFLAGMQALFKAKPRLQEYSLNIPAYDLLVIGTPVWAGNFSSAIRTFLAREKISGKKVALFATCGSNPGKAMEGLKDIIKGSDVVAEEVFVQSQNSPDEISEKALRYAGSIRLKLEQ